MDKHRQREVAVGEHLRNVLHVLANGFTALAIIRLICLQLNSAAVAKKMKMVMSHCVAEAHALVAALVDAVEM